MKQPWEWVESDIASLISNRVQEDLSLDYKACAALEKSDKKKAELSKDVSAFANSAGGTLVYGVCEDAAHFPSVIDSGYLPIEISKEWLEQVINSTIKRRIDGIRINQVQLSGTRERRVLYVVYVPQSARAPHMSFHNKFYKRHNFESIPMEEYEVRDAARRSESPDLKITFDFQRITPVPIVEITSLISNDSAQPADHVVVRIYLDARMTIFDFSGLSQPIDHILASENGQIPVKVLTKNWSSLLNMPIWEGEAFRITDTPLKVGLSGQGDYVVGWRLSAPRMNPKQGFYTLHFDGASMNVTEHSVVPGGPR